MTAPTFTRNNISANEERGAVLLNYKAAVAISIGDAVYLDSNNLLNLAIATSAAASRAIGIVTNAQNFYGETAIPAGGWAQVCVGGPVEGFTGLANGQQLWVDKTTAGALSTTAPATAYDWIVGQAVGSDTIFIRPGTTTPASV